MNQFFNSKTVLALSAGFLLSLVPASATTAVFTPGGVNCANAGICSAEVGATTITFDGLGASTLSPYVTGIATFSYMNGSPFVNGSVSGEYAAPPNDNTDYLSIGSPNKA
ncbi:MAG: hypothetical protein H7Y20_05900, partial [Bryobacteraceae bacterium]|nr:hypothetical protein [Bryobacteraceae bacterium]